MEDQQMNEEKFSEEIVQKEKDVEMTSGKDECESIEVTIEQ